MNTEFKWTDENVKEFVTDLLRNGFYDIPKHVEDFKASKQPKWDILSLKNENYIYKLQAYDKYIYRTHLVTLKWALDNKYEIHSVKRLSDNTVWALEDKFLADAGCPLTIKSFEINGTDIKVWSEEYGYWLLNNIKKAPIFTTEDGVDYYNGVLKDIFCICKDSWHIDQHPEYYDRLKETYNLFFSTKEKAEEYILWNKPLFSLKEIHANSGVPDTNPYFQKIVQIARKKMNNQ